MNFKTMKAAMKGGQGLLQKSSSIKQKEEASAEQQTVATKPDPKEAAVSKPQQDNKALAEI